MQESSAPGVLVSLTDLLEARLHCRELRLFGSPQRSGRQHGKQRARLRGRGVDFDRVRIYQPGDDMRSIDWRVTARTGAVHTKVFNEERERPVFVLCEQSSRLFFGSQLQFKSVLAAECAALIGWSALANNDRIGGLIVNDLQCRESRPRRNRHALINLLRHLHQANHQLSGVREQTLPDQRPEPVNLALRHAREILRPGSIVFILCDHSAIHRLDQGQLAMLAAHNEIVLLPISDPLDAELPAGIWDFTDGVQQLQIDSRDARVRYRYQADYATQQQQWQKLASRIHAHLLPLITGTPALAQLSLWLNGQLPRHAP
ncbi:DUF58 domain-containing protein [Halopseudomonas salegens]|uniref:DUF58 domain-containing protein n=1 Tax=Halopseudomonas salegens TaxID=1434072 RepID=A0A1H2EYN2_9GAMM|nr:DUF58 domain-containing protein [Halopseudomonas salegens]SDU00202.1 Protein of unknown function DUF58 [Halopseudomonas salegens]